MNKSTAILTLIVMLVSGCGGQSALDQAGTMVAQTVAAAPPTETPLPTDTLLPPITLTPKPTTTPITALTATIEAANVLSELDVYVGQNSGFPYREGHLAWRQTKPVILEMSGPQKDAGILQAIGDNINAKNFIFKSTVTWNASGILICGLVFRAEDLNKGQQHQFYFYRLSGLPAYKIDVYDFGRFKNTISDVRFSEEINSDNDASNEFVLIAQNEQFTVFINGNNDGQFYDESQQRREDGLVAFLAWQDSGKGSCIFENSWLWILP